MSAKRTKAPVKKRPKKSARPSSSKLSAPEEERPVVFVERRQLSPLRGILPSTPEIDALVERTLQGRPASAEARQSIEDNYKLQYYFGGHYVSYRQTERGKEVLAAGL